MEGHHVALADGRDHKAQTGQTAFSPFYGQIGKGGLE